MPRRARKKGESGIYHAMLRGINKQTIFEDEEDDEKLEQVLKECKKRSFNSLDCEADGNKLRHCP